MARDAALLHTSDGQLETALTLFDAAIGAFLRAGAVAQLTITLASLPALLRAARATRGRAAPCSAPCPGNPASFHHVPSLPDLERARPRPASVRERADRCAASGAAMDLPDVAAYALHQIDEASQALATSPVERGGPADLTARETQVLRLIADGRDHPRDLRAAVHLGEDRRQPHPAHLHQARRHQPRRRPPGGPSTTRSWSRPPGDRAGPEMGTRNEEISSCAGPSRRNRIPSIQPTRAGRCGDRDRCPRERRQR